jgi:phage gp16-like protein
MQRLGWQPTLPPGVRRSRFHRQLQPLADKVRALLADASRPDAYADAMARHMFGVARWEWLDADQLHRLVAALEYDRARRADRQARGQ